eukprot:Ihof_evm17s26 gene=Ihof_evmTU17s26
MKVNVKCASGEKAEIEIESLSLKVADFKAILERKTRVPASEQRLIVTGHVLKDEDEMGKYDIKDNCVIHMVRAAAPRPVPTQNNPVDSAASPAYMGANAMGGMGGRDSRSDILQLLATNPQARAIIEAMLSDPRAVEEMLQSPELANDPVAQGIFRALVQNPEAMRGALETLTSGGAGRPLQQHIYTSQELSSTLEAITSNLGIVGPPQQPVTSHAFANAFMATYTVLSHAGQATRSQVLGGSQSTPSPATAAIPSGPVPRTYVTSEFLK